MNLKSERGDVNVGSVTLKDAYEGAKKTIRVIGWLSVLFGSIWYLRGYLDRIETNIKFQNQHVLALMEMKPTRSEVTSAFKQLGDSNRDVLHRDQSLGLVVPELKEPASSLASARPASLSSGPDD